MAIKKNAKSSNAVVNAPKRGSIQVTKVNLGQSVAMPMTGKAGRAKQKGMQAKNIKMK